MARCLFVTPLRGMQRWDVTGRSQGVIAEPRHPHTGIHLALYLEERGHQVRFINETETFAQIAQRGRSRGNFSELLVVVKETQRFDAIVSYSTTGAVLVNFLSSLPGKRPRLIFVLLTYPNPSGWRRTLRWFLTKNAVRHADAVIVGLHELVDAFMVSGWKCFYAPTTVDTRFFDRRLAGLPEDIGLLKLQDNPFVLIVGDSSRDDEFLYAGLRDLSAPIVRVTRDPQVVSKVQQLILRYGRHNDLLLCSTSFHDLRWLYSHCRVCVIAAKDEYQGAGLTSLAEALACGTPVLCSDGGCIERELKFWADESGLKIPVHFYRRGDQFALSTAVNDMLSFSEIYRSELKEAGRLVAERVIPIERSYEEFAQAVLRP